MSSIEPLVLYHSGASPNPWKVAIILEELDLPYKLVKVDNVKGEKFLAINPNGRVPALEDSNTKVTTWESGSIIDYLIDQYDTEHKLSFTSSPEKFEARNWAHFQMSGQGPYFGQKAWFTFYHSEKIPSAVSRYANEIKRVLGVIESRLTSNKSSYLVGNHISYADLMFVPWNSALGMLLGETDDFDFERDFPKAHAWHQSLIGREAVKRMEAKKAKELAARTLAAHHCVAALTTDVREMHQ